MKISQKGVLVDAQRREVAVTEFCASFSPNFAQKMMNAPSCHVAKKKGGLLLGSEA